MKIAVIPARGGSKRIPRKNIKEFAGKPIIAYSIEAALESGCFDKVIVSTDDLEIADVAKKHGAEVPFLRPSDISDDYATTADVLEHAIDWYEMNGESIDTICCIYATAPFISSEDINACHSIFTHQENADYCFPVCEFPFPIQRGVKLDSRKRVSMFQPEHFNTRSQDLEAGYHDAAQFYWGKPDAFKRRIPMFSDRAIAFPIQRKRVVDLDTPEDWDFALTLFKAMNS
ncbi:acylneuraminate cytidylyltransferase family protein [Vibrio halioticoli NBRC 102217]|uniref:Acylneuraminate cytidylyltransferase family protein n=1 Tax=Vibrio halioticoli NBRC 102217 TaxID=1219072 RepID=V5EYU8_9VIBR|nr:pseudaminic acid cytidylyltransferase [Vibrio halioticoli]GAD87969.1 acylneuraminate cytidylyltransferase family protein [Vibrio halioticoli NBRC 102217]